jgi:transposase
MYIATVPNRNSPPAILLREGFREDGKVKNRTLANLSKLPPEAIEVLRRLLKGEKLVSAEDAFEIVPDGSRTHGNVDAVLSAMRRLDMPRLINSRASRKRDLVVAMVAARILKPQSKLATTRWWIETTLPEMLGVEDADEDELYEAMDWLLERQGYIEKKLAARHLKAGGLALYDLTSSYFEGVTCPLAEMGYNRDGKKGKLQVNYGLLTNAKGIPVSTSVFPGNSGDPKTLLPQVDKMRSEFGISRFVMVGDRGMITQKQVDALRPIDGVDWISALRPTAIHKLVADASIQLGLFDECNLFELEHPDFPGERLVACRNPELAVRRERKREALLKATIEELEKVRRMVHSGRIHGQQMIKVQTDKVLKQYRIGNYYQLEIQDDGFDYQLDEQALLEALKQQAKGNADKEQELRARAFKHQQTIVSKLDKLRLRTTRGRLWGKDNIGVRVGRVVNKYKMAKHFVLHIEDDSFDFEIDQVKVDVEAALDGIYVVRTSLEKQNIDADQVVRSYKLLSEVELAFRCLKSIDLLIRPLRHRLENRVRAHIFLCMLAYYVMWHMIQAWRPLLFADEDQAAKASRDPVAPAVRSKSAMAKVHAKQLEDGSAVHSFRTLLEHLGSIVSNTCRCPEAGVTAPTFQMTTNPNDKQRQALELLQTINV